MRANVVSFTLFSDCSPLSGEIAAPATTDPVCITSPNYHGDKLDAKYSYDMGDSCTWMINVGVISLPHWISTLCDT